MKQAMSSRQHFWTVAACLHFVLVVCGAAKVSFTGGSLPVSLLGQYADISGANNTYCFFAPGVASMSRVTLVMRDAHGPEWEDVLVGDPTTMFGFRAAGVLDGLPDCTDRVRRGVTASWASVM